MSKTIQVRGVPDKVHRILKSRAARDGMTLSAFINRELERLAERPTMREWLQQTLKPELSQSKGLTTRVVSELRDRK
jgi:antitoxin FitA